MHLHWMTFWPYVVIRRVRVWEVWRESTFCRSFETAGEAEGYARLAQEADSYPAALESRKARGE